jgi:hypothetical protein
MNNFKRGNRCPYDYVWLEPGTEWSPPRSGWGGPFCGESCYVAYVNRFGQVVSPIIPDPRYHRVGDGWHGVTKWIRRKVSLNKRFKKR